MATQALHLSLVVAYLVILGILTVFGVHRYLQVYLYYKHLRQRPVPKGHFETLPRVTVQLPMYNERYVAQRIIEAACQLDYPRNRLQIQVLDDSTDDSAQIARETCEHLAAQGFDIEYRHRIHRQGFKAGALEEGLQTATGELIAIFDADFVPLPETIRSCIDYFTDPKVGCVQARWAHLNRDHSILTRCQAIFLDGHFVIEHTARNRSGRFMNFNGTAGMWRRVAIQDAGGWHHDTLTEDVDLSYRAQLKGWKFVFLPDLLSPAELPPEIAAFKQQQHRWTKGSVQTARKLMPTILRAPLAMKVKVEAFFHLCSGIVYPSAVLLSLLLYPTFSQVGDPRVSLLSPHTLGPWLALMSLFGLLTCSAGTFYLVSQKEIGGSWHKTIWMIPALMALGMGISLINAIAVMEGYLGHQSEFVRTPKYGSQQGDPGQWKKRASRFRRKNEYLPFLELGLALYLLVCIVMAIWTRSALLCLPFLFVFMTGYAYVGILTLYGQWLSSRPPAPETLRVQVPTLVA